MVKLEVICKASTPGRSSRRRSELKKKEKKRKERKKFGNFANDVQRKYLWEIIEKAQWVKTKRKREK